MSEQRTVHPRPLRRGWFPRGRLEAGVILGGIALLGLLAASSTTTAGERPATERPVLVDRLPDSGGLLLRSGGHFAFPTVRRNAQILVPSAPTATLGTTALRRSSASGFSDLLMERMNREINRLEKRDRDDLGRVIPAWAGMEDNRMEQLRAHHAERILTKAFDKALDLQLEQFARTTAGLGGAWDWVENLGQRTRSATAFNSAGRQGARNDGQSLPPRFTAGIGFKVAAHPRVILHTELFKIRGRVDIPLRNEPIMVTVERQVGSRTHLRLTSGLSRDNSDDWVNLSLRLGF